MIDLIRAASWLQFLLGVILVVSFVMIVLQGWINRRVWNGYLALFFGSMIALAVTLR